MMSGSAVLLETKPQTYYVFYSAQLLGGQNAQLPNELSMRDGDDVLYVENAWPKESGPCVYLKSRSPWACCMRN